MIRVVHKLNYNLKRIYFSCYLLAFAHTCSVSLGTRCYMFSFHFKIGYLLHDMARQTERNNHGRGGIYLAYIAWFMLKRVHEVWRALDKIARAWLVGFKHVRNLWEPIASRWRGGDSHINRTGVLVKPFWRDNTNFLFGMIYVIFCQSFTKSVVSAGLTRNQLFPQD